MTLQKQTVGIPLLGLNSLADSKSATAGEFDLVENMFFNKTARGGAMLQKRYGGAALALNKIGGGTAISIGSRLATFGDERLMIGRANSVDDPGTIFSYSPTVALWKQTGRTANMGQGSAPNLGLTAQLIATSDLSAGTLVSPDVAVNPAGTLMCAVWADASTVYLSVIDLVTGETLTRVASGQAIAAVGFVRVIALSTGFMVFRANFTAGKLTSTFMFYATLALGPDVDVAVNLNASCKADFIKNGSNDSVLFAYHNTTPATTIGIWNANQTLGGAIANAEIPSQAIAWVDWDFSDGNGYLAFVSAATGAKVHTVTQAGPAVSATTTMDAAVTSAANITGFKMASPAAYNVFIEVRAAATYNCLIRRWPGSGASFVYQRSVGLAGKCFKAPNAARYYLPVVYDSTLQSGYYLFDVSLITGSTQTPIVGRALYGLGGGLSASGSLGAAAAISSTVTGLAVMKLLQNPVGTKVFGPCLLRFDHAAASVSGAKRVGEQLHLSGGTTRAYDGLLSTELGFHVFPEAPTLAQAAAGSLTLLGSYQFAIVYAWPDGRGQWHRSAPSPLASITLTGGNNQVNVTLPNLRLTNKSDAAGNATTVYAEVYRTVAGGTTLYRTKSATSGMFAAGPGADTTVYNDTDSDALIQANEILYTTGKVLPRIGPPMARLQEAWRNRLFLAGTENPLELWVSNEYSPGLGGVSFSDALVISMESEGGPITALCEMDDRLVICKRNAIYVLTGNGPTLTGDNQYQQPARLNSTVGAVEQRGVVRTRDGVMFKSTRGIYMLTHTGAVVYAGAGADAYNSLTVTGACMLEDEEQVRFTTAEGRTLVYHYGFADEQGIGRWTTFTNQPAVDCIVWNGKFVFLKSDGTVVEETVGAYTDPSSTSITAKVRWAWLSLTQFFGRFKLYGASILGDFLASHTLTHRLAYDYDATVVESETKAVTAATLPPLQLSPARRRAVAIQPTLEETSTTQGFTVSGLGLEVGIEPGALKTGTDKFLT